MGFGSLFHKVHALLTFPALLSCYSFIKSVTGARSWVKRVKHLPQVLNLKKC